MATWEKKETFMRPLSRCIMLLMALSLVPCFPFYVSADHHGRHGKHKRHGERFQADDRDRYHSNSTTEQLAVTNQTYKENCGACHFAYQPWLLPSGSWTKLLSNLNDHFGEAVDIDNSPKEIVATYLIDNAAEKSNLKRARRIVRCLRGSIPLRITEVPYIRRKHRRIPAEVFTRKAVGSLSKCSACHKTAGQGIYDDDYVTIPE